MVTRNANGSMNNRNVNDRSGDIQDSNAIRHKNHSSKNTQSYLGGLGQLLTSNRGIKKGQAGLIFSPC